MHGIRNDAQRKSNIVIIFPLFCIPNICFWTMTMYIYFFDVEQNDACMHCAYGIDWCVPSLSVEFFCGIMRCHEPLDRQRGMHAYLILAYELVHICVWFVFLLLLLLLSLYPPLYQIKSALTY